jgi:hypothetical protein
MCLTRALFFRVTHCTVPWCTALYFTVLYRTVLYFTVLYYTVLHCSAAAETETTTFMDCVYYLIAFTHNPHSLEVALNSINP